jgi:putative tricarboxylic transport membrane protein
MLRMPFTILAPIIFVLCFIGGFAPDSRMFDPWLILLFGAVGYLMRKLDYPMAPLVLAIVLGPLAEGSFRQTMIADRGDWTVFFTRPLSGIIMAIALALFAYPLFLMWRRKKRRAKAI